MNEQFSRTELLIGAEAMDRLAHARVIVFGIGGVGGYAVEALARCGVGAIDVVDDDKVGITNLNRQIIATHSVIGRLKVEVAAERIRDINPACHVTTHKCFFLPATADQFDFSQYDYVLDCVDTITAKLQLIERAHAAGTPIISSMGTAYKLDPTAFEVADIYKTSICPLARIIRKECRKRGIKNLKVVYSKEEPHERFGGTSLEDVRSEEGTTDDGGHRVGRAGIPASISFVPPAAGFAMAAEVVKDLITAAPGTVDQSSCEVLRQELRIGVFHLNGNAKALCVVVEQDSSIEQVDQTQVVQRHVHALRFRQVARFSDEHCPRLFTRMLHGVDRDDHIAFVDVPDHIEREHTQIEQLDTFGNDEALKHLVVYSRTDPVIEVQTVPHAENRNARFVCNITHQRTHFKTVRISRL